MKGRRGASLIELMVVISIISILFGMVGVVFHRLFLTEQLAMRAALTERTIARLADHFRSDVHASTRMQHGTDEDGNVSTLTLATGVMESASIVYSIRNNEVVRNSLSSGKTMRSEVYRLPECVIRFPVSDSEITPRLASLTIERLGTTVTPQPHASRPRRSLVIEAVLGRDVRLAQSLVGTSVSDGKEMNK